MPKVGWHPVSWQSLPGESTFQSSHRPNAQPLQPRQHQLHPQEFVCQRNQMHNARNSGYSTSSKLTNAICQEAGSSKHDNMPMQSATRNSFSSYKKNEPPSENLNNFSTRNIRNIEFSHKDDDFPSLPQQHASPEVITNGKTARFREKTYSDKLQSPNLNSEENVTESNKQVKNRVAYSNMRQTNADAPFYKSASKSTRNGENCKRTSLPTTFSDRKCGFKPAYNTHANNICAFDVNKIRSRNKQSQTINFCDKPNTASNNFVNECITNSEALGTAINGKSSVVPESASDEVHNKGYPKRYDNKSDESTMKNASCSSQNFSFNSKGTNTSSKENENNSQKAPKARKKRKSKVKRNIAFQTGKITLLTPELHSFFTGSTAGKSCNEKQNVCIDVSNIEEYPELGFQSSFNKKEKLKRQVNPNQEQNGTPSDYLKNTQDSSNNNNNSVTEQQVKPIKDSTVTEKNLERVSSSVSSYKESMQSVNTEGGNSVDCKESVTLPKSKHHDSALRVSFSEYLSFANMKVKIDKSSKSAMKEMKKKVISTKKNKIGRNPGPHNFLDSSSPAVKRGKEREVPKAKKYTAIKKIILKERMEKKEKQSVHLPEIPEEPLLENTILGESIVESLSNDINMHEQDNDSKDIISPETLNSYQGKEQKSNTLKEKEQEDPLEHKILTPSNSILKFYDCDEKKLRAIQLAIHTRNFREYCNHLLSAEIDELASTLLSNLTRFQDRLHQKDPVKARIKRRLVYGIKEVKKHLKLKKLRCVIIAPDLENIQAEGGLNHAVKEIVTLSTEFYVPCIFALRRKNLGKSCMKPVPVSCVGIFNYDGAEGCFKKLVDMQEDSKKTYETLMNYMKEVVSETDVQELLDAQESSSSDLQAVRTDILRNKLLAQKSDLKMECSEQGMIKFICNKD